MERQDAPPTRAAVGHLEAVIATHLDHALQSAGIGRWAWNVHTDECAWMLPDADTTGTTGTNRFVHGPLAQFLQLAIPEDRSALAVALDDHLRTGSVVRHAFRHLSEDGTVGRTQIDGVATRSEDGAHIVVGITRDDTHEMLLNERARSSFAQRDSIARALETSLLPPPLPTVPGFVVDADYRSSEGAATGDFYDLFPLSRSDWGLTIGDVGGHGTAAAAITSVIRYTLRAVAQVRKSPMRVMTAANDAHFAAVTGERFTTAHYVRIRRRTGGVRLRVATAGHPELLIKRCDGTIEGFSGDGPMLGLIRRTSFIEASTSLEPGDLLVAYTDGVLEARCGGQQFGREGIEAFLRSCEGGIEGWSTALHDAVVDYCDGPVQDDLATVMLRRDP